jgi:hypothetical protein
MTELSIDPFANAHLDGLVAMLGNRSDAVASRVVAVSGRADGLRSNQRCA